MKRPFALNLLIALGRYVSPVTGMATAIALKAMNFMAKYTKCRIILLTNKYQGRTTSGAFINSGAAAFGFSTFQLGYANFQCSNALWQADQTFPNRNLLKDFCYV